MENDEFEGMMIDVIIPCVSCGNDFETYTNSDTGIYDSLHCDDCLEHLDL